MLNLIKKIIPRSIFQFFQPAYHYLLAFVGAIINKFPSKKILVIGVTGTKGKSTTTEMVEAIFSSAGYKTALQNTIRFKIGDTEKRNLFKMSMPGRFFMQNFLKEAVDARCDVAILELTSEGARQFRNKFINLDALIFTNLAREHIESHGSYENYVKAKVSIAKELENWKKFPQKVLGSPLLRDARLSSETFSSFLKPTLIVNKDDKEADKFLTLNIKTKIPYSIHDAVNIETSDEGNSFQIGKTVIHMKLGGIFNVLNALGAIACARHFNIKDEDIKKGLEGMEKVRGRMEKINVGQNFDVVVDYAHTPDSLKAIYESFKDHKTICILGNTGGGRDSWKRKVMGQIADQYCDHIILANEDPYDEDPMKIIHEIKEGIIKRPIEVILDRRDAINTAIKKASSMRNKEEKVAVLITGKGTDPYIMEASGKKTPWDDATVAKEELQKILI